MTLRYAALLILVNVLLEGRCLASTMQFYTAAIYEHAIEFGEPLANVTSREMALEIMNMNVDVLEAEVMKAKSEKADIFVFPEYGITGRLAGRTEASYYAETVPDPQKATLFCPCHDLGKNVGQEILRRIGCIAKRNMMYIAVNMGDKQPCPDGDAKCPSNAQYQYNTEVVFDKLGCVVAKYHKENLYKTENEIWDRPAVVDYSYFDTDFGRFGLMICFDSVFKSPAIGLVEKYKVTDVIFSTAWMNVFPHYVSTAYHSGWARTMKVNYLSSNIHDIDNRLIGSGIYTPNGVLNYTYQTQSKTGALVVAQVPINNHPIKLGSLPPVHNANDSSFEYKVFHDKFTLTRLLGLSGNVSVCQGSVCCNLQFARDQASESYALGAYDGMHKTEYYLEICLLVRCTDNWQDCSSRYLADNTTTQFDSFELTGTMVTRHTVPQVVPSDFNFTADWQFIDAGQTKRISGTNKKLIYVELMGRNFDKDPSDTDGFNHAISSFKCHEMSILIFCIISASLSWFL